MKSVNIKILLVLILTICSNKLYSQTELYKQYEHRTEFTVMCIMQCPIIDSIKSDVTLFVSHDKEGILPMLQEFNITNLNKDTVLNRYGKEKRYPLYMYNVYKDDIKKKYGKVTSVEDYKNMSKLVYCFHAGIIMIYHDIETEERDDAIRRFLIKAVKKPLILPKGSEN
ncbi:MAG: hypothetical protein IKJ67_03530 [Bacteroidales bacterium]|nr:hypothetical protein [Bacteroidales bacterium]